MDGVEARPGRERTVDEYASLFAAAGFRLSRAVPSPTGTSVQEGVAVEI